MNSSRQLQDIAAGGQGKRRLHVSDGVEVTASVAVRRYKKTVQEYGFLQFKHDGKTVTRYLGKVTAPSKLEALTKGWELVMEKQTAEANGWSWLDRDTPSTKRE